MGQISKSRLAILLSKLKVFDKPNIKAEQYPMDSEIGAEVLWNAFINGDILGKVSVDLGCGTGILGIGSLILGAKRAYLVDNDDKALDIAKINLKMAKSETNIEGQAIFINKDINDVEEKGDVILMNPPFGTKVRHQDRVFLEKAFKIADVIYSFHKSETKRFVEAFARDNDFKVSHCYDFKFPLKASYGFHRLQIKRIEVSCFRLVNKKLFK